jgi:hypothetical protein
MSTFTLSLVARANAGKSTLARTLLGRDVGEVRAQHPLRRPGQALGLAGLPRLPVEAAARAVLVSLYRGTHSDNRAE